MRRIVTTLLSTITAVVLLFSYHTSTDSGSPSVVASSAGGSASGSTPETSTTPTPSATPTAPSGSGPGDDGAAAATPTPTATASAAPKAQSSATKTYTGDAVDTRWGPVQVQITVTAGKVTDSQAVVYPNGNGRDVEINSYALPVLSQEAVQQQSAQIDTVSGATVTSDGYVQSLQSALDQAHL
jgi:uncharacterized protein with FMN-binding domain